MSDPASMRDLARRGEWGKMRLHTKVMCWLAGFRVVERTAQVLVIRVPRWLAGNPKLVPLLERKIGEDAEMSGVRLTFEHGYRLIRVKREPVG